jgi:hypothetical protein
MNKWWLPSGAWPGTAVVFPIKQVTVGGGGVGGGGVGGDNNANSVKMCPACFLSTVWPSGCQKGTQNDMTVAKVGAPKISSANRKSVNLRTFLKRGTLRICDLRTPPFL